MASAIDAREEILAAVGAFAEEQNGKAAEFDARLAFIEQRSVRPGGISVSSSDGPTFGSRAMEGIKGNHAYENLKDWNLGTCRVKLDASIKSALVNDNGAASSSSNGGYMPSQADRGGLVGPIQRPLRLLDVLPTRPTTRDSVEFIQLGVTGDAAEQALEGDEKAELDVDGTLQTVPIVTVAAHTTASRQVMSDHTALQGQIDRMIRHKLLSRLEHQIINGAGGQGEISGLLTQGAVFLPTIGTTPADMIGEALTSQFNDGYIPSLVLLNPLDWFRVQVVKTSDAGYLFGSPTKPVPPALWNVAIVTTPSVPEGTALTVDTTFLNVLDREQPSVVLSNSHRDYFTRNLVAVLGELRAGLELLDVFAVNVVDISETSGS